MKWYIATFVALSCLWSAAYAVAGDHWTRLGQVAGNHEKYAEQVTGNLEFREQNPEEVSMMAEIRAVIDSTRGAEKALREELETDQGPELTRRLGELKRASRMRILHIQLKYAREKGSTGLERRILTSIEDLQRPAAPGGPRLTVRKSPSSVAENAVKTAGGSSR